ncbi:hypothetical protein U9M48_038375 [Paspalum notatum var. saurae]|uniref:Protein kinase domain-containing protein n=1 Tax=Paspalum notatum var. saurae TaxID=547442 RepID=A0AAQ3UGR5_PASNO
MPLLLFSPYPTMHTLAIAALHLLQFLATIPTLSSQGMTLPGCTSTCHNINISYPFGIGGDERCYHNDGFKLVCEQDPPILRMNTAGYQVIKMKIPQRVIYIDTGLNPLLGNNSYDQNWSVNLLDDKYYRVSTAQNAFIALGCGFNFSISVPGAGANASTCESRCELPSYPRVRTDGTCSNIGCCYNTVAEDSNSYHIKLVPLDEANSTLAGPRDPFNATLIMEKEEYWKRPEEAISLQKYAAAAPGSVPEVPTNTVVTWMFGNSSCAEAQKSADYGCLSDNSSCHDEPPLGYSCDCHPGYGGNPYMIGGCLGLVIAIGLGSGIFALLFILAIVVISRKAKARKARIMKEFFFKQNRGLLLQQLVDKDIAERMIFCLEELNQATNSFDEARKLGGGGHGTVYKGILSDQRIVAIKRSRHAIKREIDDFINEVAILSQVNHRNVVKLFGCCLETEVPLLVYEFISNGTLHEHLHVSDPQSLSWKERMRIALEIARSLAYLHSSASVSIIHRDIKTTNILLDDQLIAKVSDFGASRGLPIYQTAVTTTIQGTFGYLDPEYFQTSRLTEKSDVYSFGVILVELLTRKKPSSYISPEGFNLVSQFSLSVSEDKLCEILDPQVVEENIEEAREVATISVMCLNPKGEDRPTMRQVEMRLEALQSLAENTTGRSQINEEHIVRLNCRSVQECDAYGGDYNLSRPYSMEQEFWSSMSFPR